jgi:hypothetical protein
MICGIPIINIACKLPLVGSLLGDGNKQETKTTTDVRNTLVTDIKKEMNTKFSNIYSTKTSVGCEQSASQSITAGNIVARGSRGFTMQNNLNLTLDCALQKTSAKDLKNDIATSLTSAIEKNLEGSVLNKLNQDATSQLGSIGNSQSSSTTNTVDNTTTTNIRNKISTEIETKITDEMIITSKQTINQHLKYLDIDATDSVDFNLSNNATAFLKSSAILDTTDKIINTVVDSQVVKESIETKTKVENEAIQKSKAGGFGELFESIGTMFGNILGGGLTPIIIIVAVVILIIMFFVFRPSSQPPSPYGMPPPYGMSQQPPPYGMPQQPPPYGMPQQPPPYGMSQQPPQYQQGFFDSATSALESAGELKDMLKNNSGKKKFGKKKK